MGNDVGAWVKPIIRETMIEIFRNKDFYLILQGPASVLSDMKNLSIVVGPSDVRNIIYRSDWPLRVPYKDHYFLLYPHNLPSDRSDTCHDHYGYIRYESNCVKLSLFMGSNNYENYEYFYCDPGFPQKFYDRINGWYEESKEQGI